MGSDEQQRCRAVPDHPLALLSLVLVLVLDWFSSTSTSTSRRSGREGSGLRREAVADPQVGVDEAGHRGARLDLAAQVGDVDPEGVQVFRVLRSPDLGEELPVGQHTVRMLRQVAEQIVFEGGQMDFLPRPPSAISPPLRRRRARRRARSSSRLNGLVT